MPGQGLPCPAWHAAIHHDGRIIANGSAIQYAGVPLGVVMMMLIKGPELKHLISEFLGKDVVVGAKEPPRNRR